MEQSEILERLAKAKNTRDIFEQKYQHAQAEIEKLNILRIKWAGICDYLQSLLPEYQRTKSDTLATFQIAKMASGIQN